MLIRKATPEDQNEIACMIKETIQNINASDYSPDQIFIWSGRIHPEGMRDRFNSVIQYVAVDDNQIIGIGDINLQNTEVDLLYVHKEYVGKGVGTQILEQLVQEAINYGVKTCYVTASITAQLFFEKRGFVMIKEFQKKVKGVNFTVVRMEKNLDTNSQ